MGEDVRRTGEGLIFLDCFALARNDSSFDVIIPRPACVVLDKPSRSRPADGGNGGDFIPPPSPLPQGAGELAFCVRHLRAKLGDPAYVFSWD